MPLKDESETDRLNRSGSSAKPGGHPEVAKLNPIALERTRALVQERRMLASGTGAIPLTWPNKPPGMGLPQLPGMAPGTNPFPSPFPDPQMPPAFTVPGTSMGVSPVPVARFPAAAQARTQTIMSPAAAARAQPAGRPGSSTCSGRVPMSNSRSLSTSAVPSPLSSAKPPSSPLASAHGPANLASSSGTAPKKTVAPGAGTGKGPARSVATSSNTATSGRLGPQTPGTRVPSNSSVSRGAPGPSIKTQTSPASAPASIARPGPATPSTPSTPTVTSQAVTSPPSAGRTAPRPGATPPASTLSRRKRPNMTLSDLKSSPAPVPSVRPQLNGLGTAAGLVTGAMAGRQPSAPALGESAKFASELAPGVVSAPAVSMVKSLDQGLISRGGLPPHLGGNSLDEYSNVVDPMRGTLRFGDRAVLDASGVRFAGGHTFRISLDDVELLQELGRGNYGTVFKVIRCRRKSPRKPNTGLAGTRQRPVVRDASDLAAIGGPEGYLQMLADISDQSRLMAMKEIRLQLDTSRLGAIITELEILNRCMSPQIVDFFGAFFQESAVYICMEFMDGGSVDKIYDPSGMPEQVLAKIALATVQGLRYLKNDQNIIHRDIKPTNILTNTRGQVKICDFGVSGNLVGSLAKTNVGCQSYMAPERIAGPRAAALTGTQATYNSRSDIWSLGLTIVECALGRYPYTTDMYGQLESIVSDDPPQLPPHFSPEAHDFTSACLLKNPLDRPSYDVLIDHPWLQAAELAIGPTATFDPDAEPSHLAERAATAAIITAAKEQVRSRAVPASNPVTQLSPELTAAADAVLDKEDDRYPVIDRDVANWVRRGIRRRRARLRQKGIVVEQ